MIKIWDIHKKSRFIHQICLNCRADSFRAVIPGLKWGEKLQPSDCFHHHCKSCTNHEFSINGPMKGPQPLCEIVFSMFRHVLNACARPLGHPWHQRHRRPLLLSSKLSPPVSSPERQPGASFNQLFRLQKKPRVLSFNAF